MPSVSQTDEAVYQLEQNDWNFSGRQGLSIQITEFICRAPTHCH